MLEESFDILEQLPGYIGWKDTDFKHIGCNQQLASILNLKSSKHIVGFRDEELPGCNAEVYHFHRKNDELALRGIMTRVLHRSSSPYDGSLFLSIKKPLLTLEKKIKGVIYQCHEFKGNDVFSYIQKNISPQFLQSCYLIDESVNPYKLSSRELESLFCILHGMNARQIGECLGLSKRTVETYVENIKDKLGCASKSEVIIKGISTGYMNYIPQRFLKDI